MSLTLGILKRRKKKGKGRRKEKGEEREERKEKGEEREGRKGGRELRIQSSRLFSKKVNFLFKYLSNEFSMTEE